ncbi:Transferase family [Rhizoctonia solani]|uniref:Transferase family n=1 Tax=Rhizoctonia solani TaxID=456999 RepID=A0A8H7LIM1_9AGAM|nr:Transferase family [Rhizoctonia solani]
MEHFRVEPVYAMDLHSGVAHFIVTIGYISSGVVDRSKIESAVNVLIQKWPILRVRLRRSSSNVLEALIPDARHAVLATTFYVTSKGIHQVETLSVRTSTIITQRLSRNLKLYFEKSQPTLEELVSSQSPAFRLHVSCLADAAVFTFTFAHVIMGASAVGSVMRGLGSLLEGKELLDELEGDPWADLLNTAPSGANLNLRGWSTYGPSDFLASAEMERIDLEQDGPISQRIIYFPPSEIAQLKEQAMKELKTLGLEHFYGDEQYDAERTNRPIYALDAQYVPPLFLFEGRDKTCSRIRLTKSFPPDKVYLKNTQIFNATSKYANCKIRDMTLGEIAKVVRELVTEGSKQETLLDHVRWKYNCVGEFQVPVPPGERVFLASNWLTFDFGNLDISKVIKPSTDTGKVLDIYCCIPNIPWCSGCITFRDRDGGINAVFDWAEVNWTSGSNAKYAIENTVSDKDFTKSTPDGVNGLQQLM